MDDFAIMSHEMPLNHFLEAIDNFSKARILVVGDVMMDHFVYGSTTRISPEAPIPVLAREGQNSMLGGAANVAMNLLSYGAHVGLIGLVGDDAEADRVSEFCQEHRRLDARLVRDSGRATTVKTRFVAQSQQLLRVDRETPHPVIGAARNDILAAYDELLAATDIVILSDYAKGLLTPDMCRELIDRAGRAGKKVLVDPKNPDFAVYEGAHLVCPNLAEIAAVTGINAVNDDLAEQACRDVLDRFALVSIVLSRGASGISLLERTAKTAIHIASRAQAVYDVSGAGDTVISTIAVGLVANLDLARAVELANRAAGIVVGKVGTGIVSKQELRIALGNTSHRHPVDAQEALDKIGIWRETGNQIGFTNGCFDILHLGHLHSLEQARKLCDKLVVGVNSDSSVKILKGEDRPIQDQATRARILASLEMCDLVVIFDEETPKDLIAKLLPNVLFKGADYEGREIVGADIVKKNGGEIKLLSLVPETSTTATIARLRD